MLVVNRVELTPFDQPLEMRELECCSPRGLEQDFEAGDEIVEVGDVREDVVGRHQIGGAVLAREPPRDLRTKIGDFGRDPLADRDLGDVRAGSMPSTPISRSLKYCSR